jgi:mono/diheme cytochrome c family protein
MRAACLGPALLLLLPAPLTLAQAPAPSAGGTLTYEADVRPILKAHCFDCHGEGKRPKGGLDLRLRRFLVRGGKSGPAVVPHKPGDSPLYRRIDTQEMPPGKKKLSREEVALVGRWIAAGAATAGPEPEKLGPGLYITARERAFWSFQPVRRPPVPRAQAADRVRNPIDAFLQARLEEKGLSLAPEADREALIRRASFDLLGLPPTPREVADFVADEAPAAYERLIDRLLASPHYGERWGRHWLDVAGYADSEGYSSDDAVRPHAYKYRDYVIRSFNADKPFDQFIREQLAGDEMVRPPYQELAPADAEKLIATGFLRMAPDGTGAPDVDQAQARNHVVADTLQIVSTALLGLTVHCAQCHNHRYDPIPQTDYYALRAVFEPAYDVTSWRPPVARRISLLTAAERKKGEEVEREAAKIDRERQKKLREYIERTFQKELAKLPPPLRNPVRLARNTAPGKRTAAQQQLLREHPSVNVTDGSLYLYDRQAADDLKRYAERAARVRAGMPAEDFIRALTEVPGRVPVTRLFHRGDPAQPKEAVAPAGLTVLQPLGLGAIPARDASLPTAGRRLAFARMLTSGRHPLVARVLVNRVWLHHFGRGLVGTPGDFGALGERPTHPELLDWLADEFTAGGWRLKRLHRLILTSAAYRQSSRRDPAGQKIDPDNRLLGRAPVRRLEAEAIRDAVLAVSGRLNARPLGPPVPVRPDEVGQIVLGVDNRDAAGYPQGKPVSLGAEAFRRSVYVQVRRSRVLSVLEAFDAPTMAPCCDARAASTVTPQALMLMNSGFVLAHADDFAERVRREAGDDPRRQVARAWRLAFSREPSAQDVAEAVRFLAEQAGAFRAQKQAPGAAAPERRALASFCQALLSANEFLYVE